MLAVVRDTPPGDSRVFLVPNLANAHTVLNHALHDFGNFFSVSMTVCVLVPVDFVCVCCVSCTPNVFVSDLGSETVFDISHGVCGRGNGYPPLDVHRR